MSSFTYEIHMIFDRTDIFYSLLCLIKLKNLFTRELALYGNLSWLSKNARLSRARRAIIKYFLLPFAAPLCSFLSASN